MFSKYLLTILSIGMLMIVHESGHYFAARRFGMRVKKFSIGFGPTLWKNKPQGSDTTFQIGIIPFLAYVQIDGMNPFEEQEESQKQESLSSSEPAPLDKGSYANASAWARWVTLFGGSFANYICASLILFGVYFFAGEDTREWRIQLTPFGENSPAALAGVKPNDVLLGIDGVPYTSPEKVIQKVTQNPDKTIVLDILRGTEELHLPAIPRNESGKGKLSVSLGGELSKRYRVPQTFLESLKLSLKYPALFVMANFQGIVDMITLKSKPEFSGVVNITRDVASQFSRGLADGFEIVAYVSAALAFFNLLPFPGLDGGRLLSLVYELVARRKPDPKKEAMVHGFGILLLLVMMIAVTSKEVMQLFKP